MMTHISAEHIAEHEAALTGLLAWAALSAAALIEGLTPDQLRAFVHRMAASKQAQARAPRSEDRRRAPGRQRAQHTRTLTAATGVPR